MSRTESVLFALTGLDYGGAETQVVRLSHALRQRGWSVGVVSLIPPCAYVSDLQRAHVWVDNLGMKRKYPDPRGVLRLARLVHRRRPVVLHSHMVHANILARVTRLVAPVPVLICTAHSIREGGKWRELMYRWTDSLCDITTHVCRAGAERYVKIGAVPSGRITSIPNGVDTTVFCPQPHERQRVRHSLSLADEFVWLAVGRLETPKDYPSMLKAFAQVARCSDQRTVLLIVGKGELQPQIEHLAAELGVEDRVAFLGTRNDVAQLMNAADAYVMSSVREGLPMVLLEAQASGLPVVTTDVGGNREVVLDGETGFVVPPGNPDALAEAMLRLMALDAQERWSMGTAGRQHIVQYYSIERVVQQWEELYRKLLNSKGYPLTVQR